MTNSEQKGWRSTSTWLRHPAVWGAVVIVALLAAVPGCTGHQTRKPSGPLAWEAKQSAVLREAATLLTTASTGRRQRWRLFQAEQILDEGCMRRKGYTYLVTRLGHEPIAGAVTEDTPGNGYATYDVSALLPAVTVTSPTARNGERSHILPQDRYVSGLPQAIQRQYIAALNGSPKDSASLALPSGTSGTYTTGGCVGEVRARIYRTVRSALQDELVPQDVKRMFRQFLASDQSYRSALKTWQQCMVNDGLAYQTPAEAISAIEALAAQNVDSKTLDRRQHTTAAVDEACDARSHLRTRVSQARMVFLKKLPATVLLTLHQVYATREHALQKISQLVD